MSKKTDKTPAPDKDAATAELEAATRALYEAEQAALASLAPLRERHAKAQAAWNTAVVMDGK